mmetsp:Transcript_114329/g.262359  ORF Transcript_114329/g.262359 Transcript_114329/m.262359 type:complete len:776 (-) Transcript_114329:244-2571(-)
MGFLHISEPMDWQDSLKKLHYVRDHGVEQFLQVFHAVKHVTGDLLRWGDEIEYQVIRLEGDGEARTCKVSNRAATIIHDLQNIEHHKMQYGLSERDQCSWMPEYGSWMVECAPRKPFEGLVSLIEVEDYMRLRRSRLLSVLKPDEIAPTMTFFPLLGVGDFCHPPAQPNGPVAQSLFIPDECINQHPRFTTLTRNIRKRRGDKVFIARPKFKDENTAMPRRTPKARGPKEHPRTVDEADQAAFVYADAMAFGMGCCCLQVTFQGASLAESRHLYDHLAVLTPIMLAMTAATPILRGWLMDEDTRWDIVGQSVDDRTVRERGEGDVDADPHLAGKGVRLLKKSRYAGIDCYLCNCKSGSIGDSRTSAYNDVEMAYDPAHFERLLASGVDEVLAKHIAHLFSRDPLVVFKDRIELDDRKEVDHWENLQSTNWQSMRWKPPHPDKGVKETSSEDHVGWRIEFRTMEIQLTDFENAAFTVVVVLLSRVILGFNLNFYIPISKLDENMKNARQRNACADGKFWFRKSFLPEDVMHEHQHEAGFTPDDHDPQIQLQSIAEILIGDDTHPGLIPMCRMYLDFIGCDSVLRSKIDKYLDFVVARARGDLMTPAQWMRKFVTSHPDYKKDSKVPASAAYDLVKECQLIGEGKKACPEVLGTNVIPEVARATNPFDIKSTCKEYDCTLLQAYMRQAKSQTVRQLETQIQEHARQLKEQQAELDLLRVSLKEEVEQQEVYCRKTGAEPSPCVRPMPDPECGPDSFSPPLRTASPPGRRESGPMDCC